MNSDDLEVMHSAMPKRIQAVITTYGGVTKCKMECQIIAGNYNMFCCYGTIHVLSHYKKIGYNTIAIDCMLGGQLNHSWQLCFPL